MSDYSATQASIAAATTDLAGNRATGVEFWRAQAEGCERLRDLWDEIVRQAANDEALPHWTRFAAMTARDHYASQARDARAEMSRREAEGEAR